jgi:hypothetical protein
VSPNPNQVLVHLAALCLPPQEAAAPPPDGSREWQVWRRRVLRRWGVKKGP